MTTMTHPLALAALLLFTARAQAADPPATTITIPEMDCASCAKKVGGKVAEVTGVAKVEYDVKARTLKVTHKAGATPSPKALWEAVESGGKGPSKLEAPGGTHTKKPTS
jgi:copper chaperone CopZ